MLAISDFRQQFPEFTDPDIYTPFAYDFYQALAYRFLNPNFGSVLDYAAALFIAHFLVTDAKNQKAAAAGGIPGAVDAPKTAKAVDKVSASMNVEAISLEGQGFWATTSYGMRLYQLIQMFGAGGVQLTGGFIGFGGGFCGF